MLLVKNNHRLKHHGDQKGSIVVSDKSIEFRWSWKTADIMVGMKAAIAAVVLGLTHMGLLPYWIPRL